MFRRQVFKNTLSLLIIFSLLNFGRGIQKLQKIITKYDDSLITHADKMQLRGILILEQFANEMEVRWTVWDGTGRQQKMIFWKFKKSLKSAIK